MNTHEIINVSYFKRVLTYSLLFHTFFTVLLFLLGFLWLFDDFDELTLYCFQYDSETQYSSSE